MKRTPPPPQKRRKKARVMMPTSSYTTKTTQEKGLYMAAFGAALGGITSAVVSQLMSNVPPPLSIQNAAINHAHKNTAAAPPPPTPSDMPPKDPMRIILFYLGLQKTNKEPYTWQQVISFDNAKFESHHSFIQWLFPLPLKSAFNESCPLLEKTMSVAFSRNVFLMVRFEQSVVYFLKMLGLTLLKTNNQTVVEIADKHLLLDKIKNHPHNNLRITRFMQSCGCLNVPHYAWALYIALLGFDDIESIVGDSLKYWKNTLRNEFWFAGPIDNTQIYKINVDKSKEIREISEMLAWYDNFLYKNGPQRAIIEFETIFPITYAHFVHRAKAGNKRDYS